ncbi:OLC1v1013374C1 [Oldenlandia corymbosa var. corymbosa]|uniref:OLC1v1013374C1 n=1 Tax=Oldenlandia corymbosa var. corymbosa TaxID=529605 RepID=A0AAV1E1K3_OLDCO|nr:OLC1v1013374C1 [Oldenlandia corymbosa var. corymbosa]
MAPHAPRMIGNKVEIDKLTDSDKPWSVVVTVEEKQNPFGNYAKTQKMIFSDEKGAKVEGIMFGQAVGIMAPQFQACKKYRISNAPIRFIKPAYRIPGLTKQWVIGIGTIVEEVNEPITALVTEEQYTPFDSLNEFAGVQDGFVDVIGIIVERNHPQTVMTRIGKKRMIQKFCMLNEELQYVRLSLWEEFHQDVGTLLSEQVQVESDRHLPPDACLRLQRCRLRANIHDETGSIQASIFGDIAEKILGFTAREIVETPAKNVTVRVYIDFKGIPQTFYYLACKNCDAGTSYMYNTPFQCTICKVKQFTDNPRLNLRDDTDHLQANAFGVIGEKLLGVTAKKMIEEREKTLPVIKNAPKDEMIESSILNSLLWPRIQKLKFTTNMRAALDPYFSSFLLRRGNRTSGRIMPDRATKRVHDTLRQQGKFAEQVRCEDPE